MKVDFKYYVHDSDGLWESASWLTEQTGHEFDDVLIEKMGRPFYEVTLNCSVDTETGEVTLNSASL